MRLLRADLEAYVGSDLITVSLEPVKAATAYMGFLYYTLPGMAFSSRDPNPAIRIFGAFAETDVFVA
jgi:hypothetical protein